MIPSVEKRQIRPCNSCVFFAIGPCSCGINIDSILKGRPCYFHHTPEEIVELIELHNSGDFPEHILNRIIKRRAKYEKKFNNDRTSPEYLKAVELSWVLSLRKEDEQS